jgi:Protein of Unknown function (DUF2784)
MPPCKRAKAEPLPRSSQIPNTGRTFLLTCRRKRLIRRGKVYNLSILRTASGALRHGERRCTNVNFPALAAGGVLLLHLLFIIWVMLGAFVTLGRPLLRWLHLGSLVWGILVEILPWSCPLTPLENWLRTRAGMGSYQGGFLLHYLDALVYPDIPPSLLTLGGIAVCFFNFGIYAMRFRHRHISGW